MTEAEWLACEDPQPMLEFLRGKVSDRKLRLFACGCCRRVEQFLGEDSNRDVQVAEKFADGLASEDELWRAHANYAADEDPALDAAADSDAFPYTAAHAAYKAACIAAHQWKPIRYDPAFQERMTREQKVHCKLLCCIFGPLPFRSIALDPSWLTPAVTSLATAIYQERAFDRLPILADALEDAGCGNQEVLSHLRSGGEHCRGCWPLDLVLGKE
jgi:hypothetical protein